MNATARSASRKSPPLDWHHTPAQLSNMHAALRARDHRPWPLPARPWIARMGWHDLAFIHFPLPSATLQQLIPPGAHIETFDGTAWIGLVPFRMTNVAPRFLPAVQPFSTFPEINVRTYVRIGEKPGVWFFSLDAASLPTVLLGRRCLDLPYFSAKMQLSKTPERFQMTSVRRHGTGAFRGSYAPVGETFRAAAGSFEHWATERYCLYAHSRRRGWRRLEVHHEPWPLQRADVAIEACTLITVPELDQPHTLSPRCHFSTGVEVVSFAPERVQEIA